MTRKRASVSAWARGADGKAHCDACGRVFDHPSQYRLAGDEVLCRGEKACAARKAAQEDSQPKREPLTAPNALYDIGEEPWEE